MPIDDTHGERLWEGEYGGSAAGGGSEMTPASLSLAIAPSTGFSLRRFFSDLDEGGSR